MASDVSLQFVEHLRQSKHLTAVDGLDETVEPGASDRRRAKLWELTNLSPGEFADEAARFYGLDRVALQDMISATSLAGSFSQRFLRGDGGLSISICRRQCPRSRSPTPTDGAAQRAAQIVLGAGVVIRIATSEDVAVVLNQRLGEDDIDPAGGSSSQPREDDIESCGIWPAVRLSCGRSMTCSRKRLSCAPAISTSSRFLTGSWSACGSMACCGRQRRRRGCCRKP